MSDERPKCSVCDRPLSPNGHCHRCLELKALARDPGFYNVCVVLGDGRPLPPLDDKERP